MSDGLIPGYGGEEGEDGGKAVNLWPHPDLWPWAVGDRNRWMLPQSRAATPLVSWDRKSTRTLSTSQVRCFGVFHQESLGQSNNTRKRLCLWAGLVSRHRAGEGEWGKAWMSSRKWLESIYSVSVFMILSKHFLYHDWDANSPPSVNSSVSQKYKKKFVA